MISPLTSIMMGQTAKFSPQGSATELVGEAPMDNEAVRRMLRGLTQLVFISHREYHQQPLLL